MERPTKQPAANMSDMATPFAERTSDRRDLALQFGLIWLFVASVWHILGPEPITAFEHWRHLLIVHVGCTLVISFWIAASDLQSFAKWGLVSACLLAGTLAGINSTIDFDRTTKALQRAEIKGERIVHQGIGISYAKPAGFQENLEPRISRSQGQQMKADSTLQSRLQRSEMAILNNMVLTSETNPTGSSPTTIIFTIQHDNVMDLNNFFRKIRLRESKMASLPNMQITRRTHRSLIAGNELLEFEIARQKPLLISRHAYLRRGTYILNFVFNTSHEEDRPLFDDFLRSIHLE